MVEYYIQDLNSLLSFSRFLLNQELFM